MEELFKVREEVMSLLEQAREQKSVPRHVPSDSVPLTLLCSQTDRQLDRSDRHHCDPSTIAPQARCVTSTAEKIIYSCCPPQPTYSRLSLLSRTFPSPRRTRPLRRQLGTSRQVRFRCFVAEASLLLTLQLSTGSITVQPASLSKCPRCWTFSRPPDSDKDVCARCHAVVGDVPHLH